jgi:hypothetical protein
MEVIAAKENLKYWPHVTLLGSIWTSSDYFQLLLNEVLCLAPLESVVKICSADFPEEKI